MFYLFVLLFYKFAMHFTLFYYIFLHVHVITVLFTYFQYFKVTFYLFVERFLLFAVVLYTRCRVCSTFFNKFHVLAVQFSLASSELSLTCCSFLHTLTYL